MFKLFALPGGFLLWAMNFLAESDLPETPKIPMVRDVLENAGWLSRQQISVWFAIVTILFGLGIFMVIKWLLAQFGEQRRANTEMTNKMMDYLARDHQQAIVLQRETNTVMADVVKLLDNIQTKMHDEEILRSGGGYIVKPVGRVPKPGAVPASAGDPV